jgi:uncharacterized protein (DUF433 family)
MFFPPILKDFPRIEVNPEKLNGRPCIKGTRITVYDVLDYLRSGMSIEEIVENYPPLTQDDVKAALDFVKTMHNRTQYLNPTSATH